MLKRSGGTSRDKSVGFSSSFPKLDGDVMPPAKRQLLPTIAIGSEMDFWRDMAPAGGRVGSRTKK